MFDFTDDLSQFFKAITKWLDYFTSSLNEMKDGAGIALEDVKDIIKNLPVEIQQIILATLSVWVFFLFRNGKGG